jgi:TonB family protein
VASTAIVHAAIVAAALYLPRAPLHLLPDRSPNGLTFIDLVPPPEPVRRPPPPPLRLPPVTRNAMARAEPISIEAERPAAVEPRADLPRAPERRSEPARVEPPVPVATPRTVTVGAFSPDAPSVRASESSRVVQQGGFDAPAAHAPEIQTVTAAVGAFEQSAARARPQPGTDRPNVVGVSGFGTGTGAAPARPGSNVVQAGGFDSGSGAARGSPAPRAVQSTGFDTVAGGGRGAPSPRQVASADFDARRAAAPTAQATRPASVTVPLEILTKPTPVYTDQARALGIEGEVLLEVEFTATGDIRVLRVIRGLGHGLDESATRAVRSMRFRPARRDGEPVDARMTVTIVFRLA